SWLSPWAPGQTNPPLSRSMAVMRPYGGFRSGSPCGDAFAFTAPSFVVAVVAPPAGLAGASAPTFSPGPEMYRTPVIALPETYGRSENSLLGGGSSPRIGIAVNGGT